MITIESLSISFGQQKVLNNLNFNLVAGTRTVLLGPNGAGKSTLIRTIAGLQPSTSGTIRLNGHRIALLGQTVGFPKGLRVKEVLGLVTQLADRPRDMEWLIHCTSVESILQKKVEQLSGGQHRRLAIALSLIEQCDLLLLDEPSQALDQGSKQRFWQGIRELDCMLLLCTHDIEEAQSVAEELLILDGGHIIYHGGKAEFLTQLQRHVVRAHTRLQQFPWPAQLEHGQVTAFCQKPEPIVHWLLDHDNQLEGLQVTEISLGEAVQQFRQGVAA